MKKLTVAFLGLLLLFALSVNVAAADETSTSTNAGVKSTSTPSRIIDLVCMQTAVGKRDNAVISAVGKFSASSTAALTARRDALKTAWTKTDKKERKDALKTAWKTYLLEARRARKDLNRAKYDAWRQYNLDRKACRVSGSSDEGSSKNDVNL